MARAGFRWISCSPDSAADPVLEVYGKGCTQADVAAMAQATRRVGLTVMWSFLFGGPGETIETARETVRFVEQAIHPDDTVILGARVRIYPNTRLAALATAEGYPQRSLDPAASGQFYLSPDVDARELDALLVGAHQRLPNVMFFGDGQTPMVGLLQRLNGLMKSGRPAWTAYPAMRRRLMRLGRRPAHP